jgi:hypothetical protein
MIAHAVEVEDLIFPKDKIDYSKVHDRVVSIDPYERTVTLRLSVGMSNGAPTFYFTMDSTDPGMLLHNYCLGFQIVSDVSFGAPFHCFFVLVFFLAEIAALEYATHTSALSELPCAREFLAISAVDDAAMVINGPEGVENPIRQGINSVLSLKFNAANGEELIDPDVEKHQQRDLKHHKLLYPSPLNVFSSTSIPGNLNYSPLMSLHLAEWTPESIKKHYRTRVIDYVQLMNLVDQGFVSGPAGAAFGRNDNFCVILNSPIVYKF